MHLFSGVFVSVIVSSIFMHCLEGFLNPSLNIWLFHPSRKRPQWSFSHWNRAIGTHLVPLLMVLDCATFFEVQYAVQKDMVQPIKKQHFIGY